jgi:hypothetical protein
VQHESGDEEAGSEISYAEEQRERECGESE